MNRQYKLFFSWQSEDKKSRKTLDVALQNAVDTLDDRGIRLEIDRRLLHNTVIMPYRPVRSNLYTFSSAFEENQCFPRNQWLFCEG